MNLDRRNFLKLSGAGAGVVLMGSHRGGGLGTAGALRTFPLRKKMGETATVCAFCAGGCGILVGAEGGKVVSVEGNPDHPINRGALCSKAQALYQMRTVEGADNPRRLSRVLYRPPGGTEWEEKSWDWALPEIAKRVKQTRDRSWIATDKDSVTVNRTEAIAQLGGAAHDNEECYALVKMARSLGIVYLEHQARI